MEDTVLENYSVLMSVYKKENPDFLRESIKSVLAQTVPTNDFVLVCDGPLTSELDNVIEEFTSIANSPINPVRLEQNVGLGKALNFGMSHCKNEIIARMDSDDIALPDRCERQLLKFSENENLDVLSGTVSEFETTPDIIISNKTLPQTNREIHKYSRRRNPFNHPAIMYKKSAVLNAGGYLDFPLFEDYYLWIRMLRNGANAYNIKEPLCYMRAGESMYSRRGGFSYLKKALKFRGYMLKNHYCSFIDYLISMGSQTVMCIIPIKLRTKLYSKFLRGGNKV